MLSIMCHFIGFVDTTHTVCNFLQRTKLIYFFKEIQIYIYIYIYIFIYKCHIDIYDIFRL